MKQCVWCGSLIVPNGYDQWESVTAGGTECFPGEPDPGEHEPANGSGVWEE